MSFYKKTVILEEKDNMEINPNVVQLQTENKELKNIIKGYKYSNSDAVELPVDKQKEALRKLNIFRKKESNYGIDTLTFQYNTINKNQVREFEFRLLSKLHNCKESDLNFVDYFPDFNKDFSESWYKEEQLIKDASGKDEVLLNKLMCELNEWVGAMMTICENQDSTCVLTKLKPKK